MGYFNGRFFVSATEIDTGAVPVETELDETSVNPIANGTVAAHIHDMESAFNITERVNLINPAELEFDEDSGTALTGDIPVSPGDEYTYQITKDGVRAKEDFSCKLYDAKRNYVEEVNADDVLLVVDIPEGVAYARFRIGAYDIEPAIVKSLAIVDYEPYIENTHILKPESLPEGIGNGSAEGAVLYTEQELTEEQKAQARENIGAVPEDETFDRAVAETVIGKNLLNVNAVAPDPDDPYSGGFLRGYLFNDEGVISGNSAACITDFIPVQEGSYILGSSSYGDAGRVGMAFRRVMGYDADKNLIGLLVSSLRYVSPTKLDGVAYVRLQLSTTYVDAQGQIEYADTNTSVGTEYEPYTETVVEGGYTLKPECLPADVGQLTERVTALETNGGGDTLAIDKARFDGRFNYVAYSAINGVGEDQNSREFFAWAAKKEFTALKGDIEVTSDGKLIMCHDAGFTFDNTGLVTTYDSTNATAIHDMTEEECLALQYARYSGYVCGFEEYVRICKKYGQIAWITVRNHYVEEYVPELLRVLRKYGMVKQCIISGYPSATPLQAVRAADQSIMLAYVLGKSADITTDNIDLAISLGNMLICGFNFTTYSTTDDVATNLAGSLAAIEYAHDNDIRVYECQVGSMEVADKLMEYGITGAQIMFNPSFE